MKKLFLIASALLVSLMITNPASAATNDEITAPVRAYFKALNASNTNAVMAQYGKNPVFMAQGSPASVGREAVAQAYGHVFEILDLDVELEIIEVEQINDTTAMVRTHSKGQLTFKPKNITTPESNNELFIVKLENDEWKLHRYIFATDKR